MSKRIKFGKNPEYAPFILGILAGGGDDFQWVLLGLGFWYIEIGIGKETK